MRSQRWQHDLMLASGAWLLCAMSPPNHPFVPAFATRFATKVPPGGEHGRGVEDGVSRHLPTFCYPARSVSARRPCLEGATVAFHH